MVAIEVNNEQEFNALMKHYKEIGFEAEELKSIGMYLPFCITYEKEFEYAQRSYYEEKGVEVISIKAFVKIKGIEMEEMIELGGGWLLRRQGILYRFYKGTTPDCVYGLGDEDIKAIAEYYNEKNK